MITELTLTASLCRNQTHKARLAPQQHVLYSSEKNIAAVAAAIKPYTCRPDSNIHCSL